MGLLSHDHGARSIPPLLHNADVKWRVATAWQSVAQGFSKFDKPTVLETEAAYFCFLGRQHLSLTVRSSVEAHRIALSVAWAQLQLELHPLLETD